LKINSDNEENDEDSENKTEPHFELPTFNSSNLNDCVDAILENKPSHQDMLNQLALIHGITKRESQKYIIRHKAWKDRRQVTKNGDEKKRKKANRVNKNLLQKHVLEKEFRQQNVWDKEKKNYL
jgi:hypothetical protein